MQRSWLRRRRNRRSLPRCRSRWRGWRLRRRRRRRWRDGGLRRRRWRGRRRRRRCSRRRSLRRLNLHRQQLVEQACCGRHRGRLGRRIEDLRRRLHRFGGFRRRLHRFGGFRRRSVSRWRRWWRRWWRRRWLETLERWSRGSRRPRRSRFHVRRARHGTACQVAEDVIHPGRIGGIRLRRRILRWLLRHRVFTVTDRSTCSAVILRSEPEPVGRLRLPGRRESRRCVAPSRPGRAAAAGAPARLRRPPRGGPRSGPPPIAR